MIFYVILGFVLVLVVICAFVLDLEVFWWFVKLRIALFACDYVVLLGFAFKILGVFDFALILVLV